MTLPAPAATRALSPSPQEPGTLDGSVKVKGGASDDNIVIQDIDGLHDVLVDMGSGDDSFSMKKTFVLPHILEVSGRMSVRRAAVPVR